MHSQVKTRVFFEDCDVGNLNNEIYQLAIKYFVDKLFPTRLRLTYPVELKITLQHGDVVAMEQGDSVTQGMTWEDDDIGSCTSRCICVIVNTQANALEVISTIAHELIHAKQYATGQLLINRAGTWFWGTTNYGKNPYTGDIEVDSQLPWEYAAYGEDVKLAQQFTNNYFNNW